MSEKKQAFSRHKCHDCGGHGLVLNTYTGEPDECPHCEGGWVVRVRKPRALHLAREGDSNG